MTDVFSRKKRSEIMSHIRSENTTIEKLVFKAIRKKKIYFQPHYNRIVGKPDIALPRKKIAIFIDGDFWHGFQFSKRKKTLPKKYWRQKIENNIKRDKRNRSILRRAGWKVLRVWEHELSENFDKSVKMIIAFLSTRQK